jgi:hypothetical protein
METVGRKMLRLAGADESFLDRLSKTQLQAILNIPSDKPRVVIAKGAQVPRTYLRHIRSIVLSQSEETYVAQNADVALSLNDLASYGIAFHNGLHAYLTRTNIVHKEIDAVNAAIEALDKSELITTQLLAQLRRIIIIPLMSLSQVQFRLYGYRATYEFCPSSTSIVLVVSLTSDTPQRISFKHLGKRREAYRFDVGAMDSEGPIPATIKYSKIFPSCDEKDDRLLEIYIQQHTAIQMKECIRLLRPRDRTHILYMSLHIALRIVEGPDGQPLILAHLGENDVYGYFSFVIQEDKLFILSFLPVTNAQTPEGSRLKQILHLSAKDITYLKMDSLYFLFDVDLDQIPLLKDALVQSGIYRIRNQLEMTRPIPPEVVARRTLFMKKFFEGTPLPATDSDKTGGYELSIRNF